MLSLEMNAITPDLTDRRSIIDVSRMILSRNPFSARSSSDLGFSNGATVQHLNRDKADACALRATWEKSFGAKAAVGTAGPIPLAAQTIKVRWLACWA